LYLLNNIKKCRLGYWLILAFLYIGTGQSQDFHFTQFFANKLYLGPSFAGATAQNRAIANYRNQWPGLPKAYSSTYSFSFDHYFSHFNSGLGIIAMRDVAGTGNLGALHLGICYSYDFDLNQTFHVRPGVGFNYLQRTINYSKFTLYDMYINNGSTEEVFPTNNNPGTLDASSSLIVYTSKITLGATLDHMLRPNVSLLGGDDRYPMKLSVYGVLTILRQGRLLKPIDETLSLAFMFKNFGDYRQLDLGVYWAQSPLTFGVWYRGIPIVNSDRGDSFAALVGYRNPNFSIGYSYDFTISNLIKSTSGAHEISLAVEFEKHKRHRRPHMVPCPEF
jgi:type IX secretion system PorP/SprF family membrane protein